MTEKQFNDNSFNYIAENLREIRHNIGEAAVKAGRKPEDVRLMAVTKTVPARIVNAAVENGVDLLGENRAQELLSKYDEYKKDGASIHFIGRLQTNKVRQIIDKIDVIQSLDSIKLAAEIDKRAMSGGKPLGVLIEVNSGGEMSKSGVNPEEVLGFADALGEFPNIKLRGLMTIPPICDNIYDSERYFFAVYKLFVDMKAKIGDNRNIDILSMGMSGDYAAAIKHGSTMVRIGSALFGARS